MMYNANARFIPRRIMNVLDHVFAVQRMKEIRDVYPIIMASVQSTSQKLLIYSLSVINDG